MRKKVVIIQRTLKFYRIKFFELLKEKCNQTDIELVLIYGKDDVMTFNDAEISWGIKVKNYSIGLSGKKFYYQNVWQYIKDADLIITEQASKHIINYILWILNILKIKRLAFWGHGLNFQNDKTLLSNISEFLKKKITKRIYWFFAYTELSKEIIVKMGLSPDKITVINNTLAVEDLKKEIEKYDEIDLQKIKKQIGIKGSNVCIYVGGMYKEKRLGSLLQIIEIVKKEIPDFEMIFIGDGQGREAVTNFAKTNDWVHYLGVKAEVEKTPYLLLPKLLIVPYLVGLVMIDSFVYGLPLITINTIGHGPEIGYLKNGTNGIMTPNNVDEYAKTVINLLQNEVEREKLSLGCKLSAEQYTMKSMVNNFVNGVIKIFESGN